MAMRIKLLKWYRGYNAGHVFTDMSDGTAQLLISRGIATVDIPEPERAVIVPKAETRVTRKGKR